MTESYFDIDGKPIGLDVLCIREPGWSANRIRAMQATIDELTAKIEESPATVEWVDGRATVGDVTVQAFSPNDDLERGDERWRFDIMWPEAWPATTVCVAFGTAHDEATAKRIAIAVAREMQR